jgi:hypothetical protein
MANTTEVTGTMQLVLIDTNETDYWMEVHKAGCGAIGRRAHVYGEATFAASTLTEAAADLASDFIDEGSMTLEDARDEHIHFAPCVKLPR